LGFACIPKDYMCVCVCVCVCRGVNELEMTEMANKSLK